MFETHRRLSAHGFWTYDFVLPGLLLHTFDSRDPQRLAVHLDGSPDRQFTTLDCHDGIPVRPDLDGILSPAEMLALAERVAASGGNVNSILSKRQSDGVDVHQLNCTYYSALDAMTSGTSLRAPSSCSRACLRSTTSGCSRVRTTMQPCVTGTVVQSTA